MHHCKIVRYPQNPTVLHPLQFDLRFVIMLLAVCLQPLC